MNTQIPVHVVPPNDNKPLLIQALNQAAGLTCTNSAGLNASTDDIVLHEWPDSHAFRADDVINWNYLRVTGILWGE